MASHITVGMARKLLYKLVNPKNQNDPDFLLWLNQVSERFTDDASYKGNIIEAQFETDTQGQITLPYFMDSIMAATQNGWPVPTYSEWHRYVEVGPGLIQASTQAGWPFYDLGDKFCTVADIPVGSSGLIRVTITEPNDAGRTFRIFGKDVDNNEIYDPVDGGRGELVTLANPFVETTQTFSHVTEVIKSVSAGRMTMSWVDSGTPQTMSIYQPFETIPVYHRYQIGTVTENPDLGGQTIAVKGRRRFVYLVSENDFVYPPSIGALKKGLMAVNCENSPSDNMRATANNYWADAFRVADLLTKKTGGSARRTINFSPRGAGIGPVRNTH